MEFFTIFLELFTSNLKFLIAIGILFTIDFILGFTRGVFIEGVKSSKIKNSVVKAVCYLGFIFLVLTLDTLLVLAPLGLDVSYLTMVSILFMCGIEAKSITENLSDLGIDIPEIVKNVIDILIKKGGKN